MKNENKTILSEIQEKAKKNERHYRKNDGTIRSVISNSNINYFDEKEQKWKHSDNSITETETCYETTIGGFKARLSKDAEKSSVEVFDESMSISWTYLGLDKPKARKTTPTIKMKKNDSSSHLLENEARYTNVNEGVDIQYIINSNGIKENIIVTKKQKGYSFKFEYTVKGVELRTSENGGKLEFYSPSHNKVEFTIPAPYMFDANNIRSTDVRYEVENISKNKYIVSVIASDEWFNSKERKLPAIIDPQLVVCENEIFTYKTQHYEYYYIKEETYAEMPTTLNDLELLLQNDDSGRTEAHIYVNVKKMGLNISDVYSANLMLTLYSPANLTNATINCVKSVDSSSHSVSETLTGDGATLAIPVTDCLEVAQDEIVLTLTLPQKVRKFMNFILEESTLRILNWNMLILLEGLQTKELFPS